jgi:predicted dehydrogenase
MKTSAVSNKFPPLRLGVLGCANIARQFVRDARSCPDIRFENVASRDIAKSAAFAADFGIARHEGSYEALLADPALEAVYIPLPNTMHKEWAIKALQAGKHVLCEKPLTLSGKDAQEIFATARANSKFLLEAYPYWFQPQTGDMLDILAAGEIGQVRAIQACFGFTLAKPEGNIRFNADLGGGALLDAGSYPLSFIRLVMGDAPQTVSAFSTWAAQGVDLSTMATLTWADGRRAQISCAMDVGNVRRAVVMGTNGTLETEFLNHTSNNYEHPLGFQPSDMRVRPGITGTIPFETTLSAAGSGFRFAAEAFAKVVRENDSAAIERAASASIDIARMLDAIATSARELRSVTLADK